MTDLLGSYLSCGAMNNKTTIKQAGQMVGIDFTESIDVSQMAVAELSTEPIFKDTEFNQRAIKRTTVLTTLVINEHGEEEKLTITFELISTRSPKMRD